MTVRAFPTPVACQMPDGQDSMLSRSRNLHSSVAVATPANPRVNVLKCAASDDGGVGRDLRRGYVDEPSRRTGRRLREDRLGQGLASRGEPANYNRAGSTASLRTGMSLIGFDVLVVDVEGAEEKVMRGFDIARWRSQGHNDRTRRRASGFSRQCTRGQRGFLDPRAYFGRRPIQLYFKDHINSIYLRSDVDRASSARRLLSLSVLLGFR